MLIVHNLKKDLIVSSNIKIHETFALSIKTFLLLIGTHNCPVLILKVYHQRKMNLEC